VTKLVNYVKSKKPHLKVIIWDDMIRKNMITSMSLNFKQFAKKVIPMVWNYKEIVEIDHKTLELYDSVFEEMWAASAFKGATHRLELIPNSKLHYFNHLSWLNLIKTSTNPSKFKGIALTGWSRYDHMQSVCEILPAGIPTLALCLQKLINFKENDTVVFGKTKELTKCNYPNSPTGFILDVEKANLKKNQLQQKQHEENLYDCDFPGAKIYNWLLRLKIATGNFQSKYNEYSQILNSFNLKYKFFNTMYYEKTMSEFPLVRNELKEMALSGEKEFDKYFYADLYEEVTNVYIEKYVDLIDRRLVFLNKTVERMPDYAPIRPFNKIDQNLV
jgi:hexosaminidase